MDYRIERDSMGEVRVPADRLWGAQTQRSLENFRIGTERMPREVHEALLLIKRESGQGSEDYTDDKLYQHKKQITVPFGSPSSENRSIKTPFSITPVSQAI